MVYLAPSVYINTNILRDILERRHPYSVFLQELASAGEYKLITTIVTIYETFLSESRRFREEKELGVSLEVLLEVIKNRVKAFITAVKMEGLHIHIPGPEEFARSSVKAFDFIREFKADPTDALHLAFACEYKTEYFTTWNDEILKMESSFYRRHGIQILRPESLVPVVYERLEEVRGTYIEELPPCIKAIHDCVKKGVKTPSVPELVLLANFLRRCFNYSPEEIQEAFKTMLGYDRELTEAALRKYPPLIWFCEEVKRSIPYICPHSSKPSFCEDSFPLPEDKREDIIRISLAKSRSSPFYYFIRRASKISASR